MLILTGRYLPGFKYRGPIRNLANMIDRLGDEEPYPGIKTKVWQKVGKALVNYRSPDKQSPLDLARLLRRTAHDVVYLNSFFDPRYTIQPLALRLLGLVPNAPHLLAPRGEFGEGCLRIKTQRKLIYLRATALLRLPRQGSPRDST